MKMPIDYMNKYELHTIAVEIDAMRKLDHVQVIKLLDLFKDEGNMPCFIMEKYDQSLLEFIKDR